MVRDPRGGHNRKLINENFFKHWSPSMAYVLGFISADGAVIDATKSSRTCYISIVSIDKSLLDEIRMAMGSSHSITKRPPQTINITSRTYISKGAFCLRIANKMMYSDLAKLGICSPKALRIRLPTMPNWYISSHIRGYFDGDGCVSVSTEGGRKRLKVIFTSGCKLFLEDLSTRLSLILNIPKAKIYKNSGAHRSIYGKRSGSKVLNFIYGSLNSSPFLDRKYLIYKNFLAGI